MATACTETLDPASLEALLGPQLTAEQAALIFQQGQEAVVFALLTLAKQLAEKPSTAATTPDPATPSGQTPPYAKPAGKGRAKAKGAKPGHPGHRRRHHAGGHRTYDSSLLVPAVPRHGRAGRARRLAWLVHRPARRGAVGLAPLPAGYHAGADRRRVQFPPSVQALPRRPGVDVAAVAGGPFGLVPGNPDPGPPKRRAARRRDRLAGRWQDLLAVVLHDRRPDLLHDRPQPRIASIAEVLQERVRRGVGDRLLGRLQRGRLRAEAEMPAAPAARHQADSALPQARGRLAGIFQATEAADPRLAPLEQAPEGVVRGGVRLAPEPPGTTVARPAGAAVGEPARTPLGEAAAAARLRVVHVPGPSRGPVGQQSRGAPDPPGGDRAEEQLRQRQRRWGRNPGRPDERVPHPQATRPQSRLRRPRCRAHLPTNRTVATIAREGR